jgi:hypothetical protein
MCGSVDRLALTLTLALAACPDEPEPASAETPPAPAVDETVIMAVGTEPPIVRVLDAGGEPRVLLERGPVARDRQVQIAWDMSPLGRPSHEGMHMRLALTWSASDDREIPSRFSVEHADVTMADVSGGEMRVGELMGSFYALIGGHARRHGPAHVEFVQTAGMTTQPAVPWMLHLFAFAPPSEALGPGARWTMQSKTDEDEQSCTELRTYELVEVQADEITARLQIELETTIAIGLSSAPR